jgi:hypothetical protein
MEGLTPEHWSPDKQHRDNVDHRIAVDETRIFIIGTQKSGTTWLRDCLNEFVPFCKPEWYFPQLLETIAKHVHVFGGSLPEEKREAMIRKIGADIWNVLNVGSRGEKSAYPCSNAFGLVRSDMHTQTVEQTRKYFPGSKVVVIVRDPRAVFNSLRHYLDHFRKGWSEEIDPNTFASNWAEQNLRWVNDNPDAVIRYEDLKTSFATCLSDLLVRLGIRHTAADIAEVENAVYCVSKLRPQQPEIYRTGTIDEWRQKLEPEIAKSIFDITAPAMAKIGYAISG